MDPATMAMLAQMFMGGGGGGGGGAGGGQMFGSGGAGIFGGGGSPMSGLGGLIGSIFSHPDRPYKEARNELEKYLPQAQSYLNPFFEAGKGAIPQYQEWLSGMKDPSGFINKLMGGYQESPYAKYQQEQAMRSAQNMGSASGLTGSTPLTQFAQQSARDISSQDMNQWLQNVLGINTQYGAGQAGLMGQGMQAGSQLSNLMADYMRNQAQLAYGQGAAREGRTGGIVGGITKLLGF